jgi:DNA-binding transcriptional ArsR family regulator
VLKAVYRRMMMQPVFKRAVIGFVLVAIVLGSCAALLHQQKSFAFSLSSTQDCFVQVYSGIPSLRAVTTDPYCLLALPPSIVNFTPNFAANTQTPFNNSTRTQIYNYIESNPGVQFRGVCAGLCIPVGLAQYHLGVLIKAGLVSFIRDGRYKRFFSAKKFTRKEMLTISLLRHETARKILAALLNKKQLSHGELACEVSITSQALTWQMKRVGKTQFVLQTSEGLKTIYSLDENTTPTLTQYLALVEEKP